MKRKLSFLLVAMLLIGSLALVALRVREPLWRAFPPH